MCVCIVFFCIFAKKYQDVKFHNEMMFVEKIRRLREERQLPQRKLAAALEIDTATYCKIEKGERRVKREQIAMIAQWLQTDPEELLTLWLADQVAEVVGNDKGTSDKVLDVVKQKKNE